MDTAPLVQSSYDIESLKTWINFAASLGLTGLMVAFLIFLFGRENSFVYKLPKYKTIALKAGLALCTSGALLNAITMSDPSWSESLLKVGLTILFGWTAWFHYGHFVKPWREEMSAGARLDAAISAGKPARRQPSARKVATKASSKA